MVELAAAQHKIIAQTPTGAVENISLREAVGRVMAVTLQCRRPLPHFSYSLMDGYAITGAENGGPLNSSSAGVYSAKIIGEVAAGCTLIPQLGYGEAVRIMTGAAIPKGTERVIPFEICQINDEQLNIPLPLPDKVFICRRGSKMQAGTAIIRAGQRVGIEHLEALAADGYGNLSVFARPHIRFFCTGSELVDIDTIPVAGQKISCNPYLLSALIQQAGGIAVDLGTVPDEPAALKEVLSRCRKEAANDPRPHIIISTGGMGPGKYDLTSAAFREMGGEIICDSLAVKSSPFIFGRLGNILYFALPGPPPAVSGLFPLLITPAIHRLQGDNLTKKVTYPKNCW